MVTKAKSLVLGLTAAIVAVPGLAMAQYTGPDYTDAIDSATTSIKDQLVNNLPAVFGLMAITVGLGLVFKFIRRAAK